LENSIYRRERGAFRAFLVVCVRNDALTRARAEASPRAMCALQRVARAEAVVAELAVLPHVDSASATTLRSYLPLGEPVPTGATSELYTTTALRVDRIVLESRGDAGILASATFAY